MIHARPDYAPIQDPRGLIPDDEPVILIRGQDICAIQTLDTWVWVARAWGVGEDVIAGVLEHRERIKAWQAAGNVKVPDLPAVTP